MHKFLKLTVLFISLTTCNAFASPPTIIRAGKLIDVDNGKTLSNQLIMIRDGKITEVGANIAIPADANVIDLSAMTVLPGLIDCHTHLVGDVKDQDPLTELHKTAAQRAFESIPNA